MGGRKGRNGLFPATACIKLTGTYGKVIQYACDWTQSKLNFEKKFTKYEFHYTADDSGDHIMVRGCALDSGTLTTDTEIIRMSHCGGFYFDDRQLYRSYTNYIN